jgi:phosphoribosylamine--glycine ligase
MDMLVIGSGGREHALVWKLKQSRRVRKIYCTPGNGGIMGDCEPVPVTRPDDYAGLAAWVRDNRIDLTVVGPEQPLVDGIADIFEARGLRVFGPSKRAAALEGSKKWSKEMMVKYGVPTAAYGSFTEAGAALAFAKASAYPLVVKADGLAAGKGVIICGDFGQAEAAIREIMTDRKFGSAGSVVVVEEFLAGEEVSLMAFSDGRTVVPMVSAQDHKNIFEGDKGPNTGGMGAYAPSPLVDAATAGVLCGKVIAPLVRGLASEGITYKGVIYAGLMMTATGPKVLEYNCRFGDPETQVVLSLLETDLADVMNAVVDGTLGSLPLSWRKGSAASVVLAAGGYPGPYEKGKTITGLEKIAPPVVVFHAGTAAKDGAIVTSGGRVLNVTASGSSLKNALDAVYSEIPKISFDGMYFRKDIGWKAFRKA